MTAALTPGGIHRYVPFPFHPVFVPFSSLLFVPFSSLLILWPRSWFVNIIVLTQFLSCLFWFGVQDGWIRTISFTLVNKRGPPKNSAHLRPWSTSARIWIRPVNSSQRVWPTNKFVNGPKFWSLTMLNWPNHNVHWAHHSNSKWAQY